MKKIRVAVLMGGPSAEHAISLKSGQMVLKFLDHAKYDARPIRVSKSCKWPITFDQLKKNFDVVFIAMHGEYGEDGTVQRILEKLEIPFTGSGSQASELGMDKLASEAVFKKVGLLVPGRPNGFPIVIKPADRGSSVGVNIARNFKELEMAVKNAAGHSRKIMAQEYIAGRELTCGVLEVGGQLRPLLPTEIISKSKFFDYKAKYVKGASREITPPKLPPPMIKKIQQAALKAHKAIGAKGYSRTDFILEDRGKSIENSNLYVLEINTLPGMTEMSLLPQGAKAVGISFQKLLDYIIETAL